MNALVITAAGRELIASAVGGDGVVFTRLASGSIDGGEFQPAQFAEVSGCERGGNVCEVYAVIDNRGLQKGYFIGALGVYAKSAEGGEILFGVCEESGDVEEGFFMPAGSDSSVTRVTLRVAVAFDGAESAVIAPSDDSFASAVLMNALAERLAALETALGSINVSSEIERLIGEHDDSDTAHPSIAAELESGRSEIGQLRSKVAVLEILLSSEIEANPYAVNFSDLSGVSVNGIWVPASARLEF